MATRRPDEVASASQEFEDQQSNITSIVAPLVARVMASFNPDDLSGSLQSIARGLTAIVHRYGSLSTTMALRWYQRDRLAHGAAGSPSFDRPKPPTAAQVVSLLDVSALLDEPVLTPDSIREATESVQATVDELVLSQGDRAVQDATHADRAAKGWARGLEPGFCSFCGMLAARGAVFVEHSFDASNRKFKGSDTIKVHDHCHCYPIPVYGTYTPDARVQRAIDVWKSAVTDKKLTGEDARKAYRAALEGRTYHPVERAGKGKKHGAAGIPSKYKDLPPADIPKLIAKLKRSATVSRKNGFTKTAEAAERRVEQLQKVLAQAA